MEARIVNEYKMAAIIFLRVIALKFKINPKMTPPGLVTQGVLVETSSGGTAEWIPFTNIKQYTNAFIVQDGKVCL